MKYLAPVMFLLVLVSCKPNSSEKSSDLASGLTEAEWFAPEGALVAHWLVFDSNGWYKRWSGKEIKPQDFTGQWELDNESKILTLTDFKYNETTHYHIDVLTSLNLELMPTGVIAGAIAYMNMRK